MTFTEASLQQVIAAVDALLGDIEQECDDPWRCARHDGYNAFYIARHGRGELNMFLDTPGHCEAFLRRMVEAKRTGRHLTGGWENPFSGIATELLNYLPPELRAF